MNDLFLHNLNTTINKIINVAIDGNQNRSQLIKLFNSVFEEAFNSGYINRLCKVKSCSGNKNFKSKFSSFKFRSGLEINILNDNDLLNQDIYLISGIIIGNPYFVRKLISIGFDTLRMTASSINLSLDIELNRHAQINTKNLLK
jgi:hypothetical protein